MMGYHWQRLSAAQDPKRRYGVHDYAADVVVVKRPLGYLCHECGRGAGYELPLPLSSGGVHSSRRNVGTYLDR